MRMPFEYAAEAVITPELLYARRRGAVYLSRLFRHEPVVDDTNMLSFYEWSTGATQAVLDRLREYIMSMRKDAWVRGQFKKIMEDFEVVSANFGKWDRRHGLDDFLSDCPYFEDITRKIMAEECERSIRTSPSVRSTVFDRARRSLSATFGTSDEDAEIFELLALCELFDEYRRYFESTVEIFRFQNRRVLADILGMDVRTAADRMSELASMGIIDTLTANSITINEEVLAFLTDPKESRVAAAFCKKLEGKCIPIGDFSIDKEDARQVLALLSERSELPVHILLYGPPGTGKTTFARSIARELGVRAWAVPSDGDASSNSRRAMLTACLHMSARHPGSFIVMDEAERFLDTGSLFAERGSDKAWLNDFLERSGVRMIWIVNDVGHLDQSVRRRFTYSVMFDELDETARRRMWDDVLRRCRAKRLMPRARIDFLARTYRASAAVMESAVAHARELASGPEEFADLVERSIASYTTLASGGERAKRSASADPSWSIECLRVKGDINELIEKSRRIADMIRAGTEIPPGAATMLFYGPPGTGKSHFARHLASELDMPLIVKRASDLLSPYVGMSEQNIASAFDEAEGGILLIDEVDSFLYSRESAVRSWEATMVNEFLTRLEECSGFCVCTTNREPKLDEAAMRRFTTKLRFDYSGPDQAAALFRALLEPLVGTGRKRMTERQLERLRSIKYLTPGDFSTVRSKYWLDSPDEITREKLIASLIEETANKHDAEIKKIGY